MDAHEQNGASAIRDLADVRDVDESARSFARRLASGLQ
jgi:hypothetical protein